MALARMRIAGFRYDENEFHLFERSGSPEETTGDMPFVRSPPHLPAVALERRTRAIRRDQNVAKLDMEMRHIFSEYVRLTPRDQLQGRGCL